jgi:small subunit ribosomal protein S9
MTQFNNTNVNIFQAGGRKNARARVQLIPGSGNSILINKKPADTYFQQNSVYLQYIYTPFELVKTEKKYDVVISVEGGGLSAQAQAIRLALCKAFSTLFPNLRPYFKERKYLTRDSRIKERKKYGLKKARKAPQFSKR